MKRTAVCVIFCVWMCLLCSSLALNGHYCTRNVTTSTLVPVTKQRTIVKQPPKWKVWRKAQHLVETYNTQEQQISYKLVSECCPGFLQDESGLCAPFCDHDCPAHASCVAPQRCQCISGYISAVAQPDGKHYCEPICERGCPSGTRCVAPQTCTCKEGYKALPPAGDGVSAPCVPGCQLGDGCANGQCIDAERCICNRGYFWSMETHSCTSGKNDQEPVNDSFGHEDYLSSSMTTEVTGATTGQCAEGFVYYSGECRVDIFQSNEVPVNCRQTGCAAHQTCNSMGSCICNAGFVEEKQKNNNTTLTCKPIVLEEFVIVGEAISDDDKVTLKTTLVVAAAIGLLFVIIVVGLIAGLRRRRSQQQNDMSKEPELKCEFSQKSYKVDEWVP